MLPIGANLIVSGYQQTICFLGNCCKNVTRYISLFNDLGIAKRSCTHFAGGMGTPCSNKDWTAQGLRIRFAPCRCAAADEGQDSAARTKSKRGKLMGDDKLPPERGAEVVGIGPTAVDPTGGLEVFEIAGTIKWFDISKGYGFIVP